MSTRPYVEVSGNWRKAQLLSNREGERHIVRALFQNRRWDRGHESTFPHIITIYADLAPTWISDDPS